MAMTIVRPAPDVHATYNKQTHVLEVSVEVNQKELRRAAPDFDTGAGLKADAYFIKDVPGTPLENVKVNLTTRSARPIEGDTYVTLKGSRTLTNPEEIANFETSQKPWANRVHVALYDPRHNVQVYPDRDHKDWGDRYGETWVVHS
jgi:hypothetical protein